MNRGFTIRAAAVAAAFSFASLASAQQQPPPAEPTREQLQQELAELQSRIAKLESRDAQQAAAQTKQEVAADAEKRSKPGSAAPITAGYDKGFFIKSGDGNFSLKPSDRAGSCRKSFWRARDHKRAKGLTAIRNFFVRFSGEMRAGRARL